MRIAARWFGVGSIVIGALGAVALSLAWYPGPPEQLTYTGKCDCWNSKVYRDQCAPEPGPSIVDLKPVLDGDR